MNIRKRFQNSYRFFKAGGAVLFASVLVFAAGCGSGLQPVSGRITCDDRPGKDLLVLFQPRGDDLILPEAGMAKTDENGRYAIRGIDSKRNGIKPGEYTVRIAWRDPNPKKPRFEGDDVAPNPSPYTLPPEIAEGKLSFTVPEHGKVVADFDF